MGNANGFGILTFMNHTSIIGSWQNNSISKGAKTYANGDKYEGQLRDNLQHG
jgi:hypothetical protein